MDMVIDGFEILNTLYIAKRLYDMGRYEVAEANFFDTVDYDVYYENMYGLIENIFENCYGQYYEKHGMEILIKTVHLSIILHYSVNYFWL